MPRRVFEGLLAAEGCGLDEALRAGLAAVGYDADAPREAYPAQVWRAAIEEVRRSRLPALPPEAGLRELGRRFAAGFGKTPVGWVLRHAAPLFGVDRTLLSLPRYLHTVRGAMKVAIFAEGPGRYRLTADDPVPSPSFIAGCLLGILDIFELDAHAEVVHWSGPRFEIELSWDERR